MAEQRRAGAAADRANQACVVASRRSLYAALYGGGAVLLGVFTACRAQVDPAALTPGARSLDARVDSISVISSPMQLRPPVMVPLYGTPPSGPAGQPEAPPDAAMMDVLVQLDSLHLVSIASLRPVGARGLPTVRDAARAILERRGETLKPGDQNFGDVRVEDRKIPGAPGAGEIPIRIYHPRDAEPAAPVIVYYHGGGWVIANRNIYDAGARGLSHLAGAIVVSVEYRLAPEHKFPAAHDDALAAYRWATANAATFGGDSRRMALAGESAGGNLAVATALAVRDQGGTAPRHILAVYPVAQPDTTTPSYVANAMAKPLDRASMGWFFGYYLRSTADRRDPRIDLVHANLRGLPGVTIVNAQIDPLRDDGAMLEQALRAAGVPVQRRVWSGVTHEFFGLAAVHPKAMEAQQYGADQLKRAFAQ